MEFAASSSNMESRDTKTELVSATERDAAEVARIFMSARAEMRYLPPTPYGFAETVRFFRDVIETPGNSVLKAVSGDGDVAGLPHSPA